MPVPNLTVSQSQTRQKAFFSIFFTIFIDLLGFGMFIPILPQIARSFNASDTQATLLSTWFSIATLISVAIIGRLSDHYGRKKIILFTVMVSFCAQLLTGFAINYFTLVIARFVAGFASGNISAAQAAISDLTSAKERSRYMIIIGLAFGGGFALGPSMGSLVVLIFEIFNIQFITPFQGIGLLAAGLNLINIFMILFLFQETHKNHAKPLMQGIIQQVHPLFSENADSDIAKEKISIVLKKICSNKIAILSLINYFLQSFSFTGVETLLPLLLLDAYHFKTLNVYYIYIFIGGSTLFFNAFISRWILKKTNDVNSVQIGQISLIVAMASIAFVSPNSTLLLIALMLLTFGTSLANPALTALLSKNTPPEHQGFSLGVGQTIGTIARIFGPAFMGFAYENGLGIMSLTQEKSLYISCTILFTGVVVSALLLQREKVSKTIKNSHKIQDKI